MSSGKSPKISRSNRASKSSTNSQISSKNTSPSNSDNEELMLILDTRATDINTAIFLVKKWMFLQFKNSKNHEAIDRNQIENGQWAPLWGTKFTSQDKNEGIKNLGLVIGEKFYITTPDSGEKKSLGNYRVDWDPEKDMHINIVLKITHSKSPRKSTHWAYQFDTPQIRNTEEKQDPQIKPKMIKDKMLDLTRKTLSKKSKPDAECAKKLLEHFLIQSPIQRQHFETFSFLLRPLLAAAYEACQEQSEDVAYRFNWDQLNTEITQFLYHIWQPQLEAYMDKIAQVNRANSEDTLDEIIAKEIFFSEYDNLDPNTPGVLEPNQHLIHFIATKTRKQMDLFLDSLKLMVNNAESQKTLDQLRDLAIIYAGSSPQASPRSPYKTGFFTAHSVKQDETKTPQKAENTKDDENKENRAPTSWATKKTASPATIPSKKNRPIR